MRARPFLVYLAVVAWAAAAVAACTSFGANQEPPDDASAPSGDAGDAGDAGTDVTLTEASDAERPCDLIGRVVADFNDAGSGTLVTRNETQDASIVLEGGVARFFVPTANAAKANLKTTILLDAKPFGRARLRFTLPDIVRTPGLGYAEIGCSIRLDNEDGAATVVRIELNESGSLSLDEYISVDGGEFPSGNGIAIGSIGNTPRTIRVELDVEIDGDGGVLSRATADYEKTRATRIFGTPETVELQCGIAFANSDGGFKLLLDDVDITVCAR